MSAIRTSTESAIIRVILWNFVLCLLFAELLLAQTPPAPLRLVVETGHSERIKTVCISPDGTLAITGGQDGTARIWSLESGRELVVLRGHQKELTAATFFPDGRMALTASIDGTVRLWDVRTGAEKQEFQNDSELEGAVISPSGEWFAAIDRKGSINIWRQSGEPIPSIKTGFWMTSSAVSDDSRLIAVGGDAGQVRVYDVSTGQLVGKFVGHKCEITALAFSHNGHFLISSSAPHREVNEKDFSLRLWDVTTRVEVHRFEDYNGPVSGIAVVAESVVGITGSDYSIKMWDMSSGKIQRELHLTQDLLPTNMAINTSGSVFVVSTPPDPSSAFYVVDLTTGQTLRKIAGFGEATRSVALSDDYIAVGHSLRVSLWMKERGSERELKRLSTPTSGDSVDFCSTTQVLLTAGKSGADMWDPSMEKPIRHFDSPGPNLGNDKVRFSKTCKYLAIANSGGVNVHTSDESDSTINFPLDPQDISFSPDERSIAIASTATEDTRAEDSGTCFWNISSGEKEKCLGDDYIDNVASISPDGKWAVTVGSNSLAKLREIETGREYPIRVMFDPKVVSFSTNGQFILIAGSGGSAEVWRPRDQKAFGTLTGHASTVTEGSFSHDGKIIVTASTDGTVRLWNATTFVELCTIAELTDGHWVVTDKEGRFDTDAAGEIHGLHWAFPDNLLKTYSLDQYIQIYYEPRLLSRILAGENLPAVRAFTSINTVVPSVRIAEVKQEEGKIDRVQVRITVSCADSKDTDGSHDQLPCEAEDVRLFRDGQLVRKATIHVRTPVTQTTKQEEEVVFRDVKIPVGKTAVDFSAYALNTDHVKSDTDHNNFSIPLVKHPGHEYHVYLITIGVARSGDELIYPSEDARFIQEVLGRKLGSLWYTVVRIPLIHGRPDEDKIADVPEILPTKQNIRTIFNMLAGEEIEPGLDSDIPESIRNQIKPAGPDDTVIITFSGHGSADTAGNFYLFPYVPSQTSDEMPIEDRVSTDELASWLQEIDSGNLIMILDTCQAAALPGREFKAAPLGNRGIGQLAYDKGMLVLAGTQSDNVAKESGLYRHGLLTYALVQEGLIEERARTETGLTLREWLQFGENRVPGLYLESISQDHRRLQRPYLFDFSRNPESITIEPIPDSN
jgi:WD40 repeat protein